MANTVWTTWRLILMLAWLGACTTQPAVAPTVTALPPTAAPSPIPTRTAIPATITPSPLPTFPVTGLSRWQEYEQALARALMPNLDPVEVICEWSGLAKGNQEEYLWAACQELQDGTVISTPAVMHLDSYGRIERAEVPGDRTAYSEDMTRMFPYVVQTRIFGHMIDTDRLIDHLEWRRMHPEEPPLAVPGAAVPTRNPQSEPASLTMAPTPLPTSFVIPVLTPDAIQVERWKEYQTALAKALLSDMQYMKSGYDYSLVTCEWDILGRSGQKVYVWAMCQGPNAGDTLPALLHLAPDGSIRSVEVPQRSSKWEPDMRRLFPAEIREKIAEYYAQWSTFYGRDEELRGHLQYRFTHPEVPPLCILSATMTATPGQ